jgi:hypothetical protein
MPDSETARPKSIDLGSESSGNEDVGLAESVRGWTEARLRSQGFPLPLIKRISVVVTGLLRAETARRGDLVMALSLLKVTSAKPESIARRVARILDDQRLDPERILPYILRPQLRTLLLDVLREHSRSSITDPRHQQNFPLLRIVIDESTKLDEVHILVAGLAYQGIVIPLAIRVWKQNTSLASEDYRTHLAGLLTSVEEILPPDLRQHVLLLADRAYGRPNFTDLINALGWNWLVRIQGQTQIKLSDETVVAARSLVNHQGEVWCSGFNPDSYPRALAAFKKAGWRDCQFVAAWTTESDDPWLLITNLKATKERFLDYASRWCVERTFLTWKSHGWDIESLQMSQPEPLGRYLVAISIATLWSLVTAVAHTIQLVQERQDSRKETRQVVVQLRLPFDEPPPDRRPWIGKFSLLTWGRNVLHHAACQSSTPPMRWVLPDWNAPVWSVHSQDLLGVGT